MAPSGLDYENIGWDDLVGDNALQLMTDFCNRCRSNPSVSDQTNAPYGVASLQNTLGAVIRLLQVKFSVQCTMLKASEYSYQVFEIEIISRLGLQLKKRVAQIVIQASW